MEVLLAALEAHDRGEQVVLVTVVTTAGSTPRHPGAHMAVRQGGEIIGTIGGGRIEHVATEAALEVIASGVARRLDHHLVRDLAMCCGGSMGLFLEPLAPSAEVLRGMAAAHARRETVCVELDLGGGPRRLIERASAAAASTGLVAGGEVFRWVLLPTERLVIFGHGHVARALLSVVAGLDFEIVVADDNETDALATVPAGVAHAVDSFDVRAVERAIGALGARDYVVILTRDHAVDERIVEQLIERPSLTYLGLIGSQGKVGRFRKRLATKGLADEAAWSRLRAPIGLEVGAETPAEIAVAIAAELIAVRHQRSGT